VTSPLISNFKWENPESICVNTAAFFWNARLEHHVKSSRSLLDNTLSGWNVRSIFEWRSDERHK